MELKGLKINFLGDSITEGHGTSSKEATFWSIMKRDYGLAEARGYGIGGTRYAHQTKPSARAHHDRDFCSRYIEMDKDADAVLVFGGTNDFGHGDAPIGVMTDRTSDTFYGACHCLYSGLLEMYPEAVIVILTPLHRLCEDSRRGDGCKTQDGATLSEYANIIKEVAEYYSLPVCDLRSMSGIQPKVDIIREKYCPDGLHPSDAGHALLAKRIAGFLKSL